MVYFSATTLGFYPEDRKSEYEDAGVWPTDAVALTDSEASTYWRQATPGGQRLGAKKGRPVWIDLPPLAGDDLKASLKAAIADRRYAEESSGVVVDGNAIETTRDSQALINGAALSVLLDPAYVCNWKTSTGFLELDASQLKSIAIAVRAHVQACFDRESALVAAVDSGTYKPEMLEQGWPGE